MLSKRSYWKFKNDPSSHVKVIIVFMVFSHVKRRSLGFALPRFGLQPPHSCRVLPLAGLAATALSLAAAVHM